MLYLEKPASYMRTATEHSVKGRKLIRVESANNHVHSILPNSAFLAVLYLDETNQGGAFVVFDKGGTVV